jgi:hypothetical protein
MNKEFIKSNKKYKEICLERRVKTSKPCGQDSLYFSEREYIDCFHLQSSCKKLEKLSSSCAEFYSKLLLKTRNKISRLRKEVKT